MTTSYDQLTLSLRELVAQVLSADARVTLRCAPRTLDLRSWRPSQVYQTPPSDDVSTIRPAARGAL